jgi:DNA-binding NtrC family response regulator
VPDSDSKVLVIDDEETLIRALKAVLEGAGFTAIATSNPREGIQLFTEHKDDIGVVLLDLLMPELRGEAVLEELRTVRSDVKVVLMSGFLGATEVEQFSKMGFYGFLPKPFDPEDVIAKVSEILEKK